MPQEIFKTGDRIERFVEGTSRKTRYGIVGSVYTFVKYDRQSEHVHVLELREPDGTFTGCKKEAFRLASKPYNPEQQPYDEDDI